MQAEFSVRASVAGARHAHVHRKMERQAQEDGSAHVEAMSADDLMSEDAMTRKSTRRTNALNRMRGALKFTKTAVAYRQHRARQPDPGRTPLQGAAVMRCEEAATTAGASDATWRRGTQQLGRLAPYVEAGRILCWGARRASRANTETRVGYPFRRSSFGHRMVQSPYKRRLALRTRLVSFPACPRKSCRGDTASTA